MNKSKPSPKQALSKPNWDKIYQSAEFQKLIQKKKRFMILSTLFFAIYYLALPICTGYFQFLNVQVIGSINAAYLFAISQFFMAWILAILYVRHTNKTDQLIQQLINKQKEDTA